MSSITELIRNEIESLSNDATRTNIGTISTLADGVAKVDGLSEVMYNEMIEFPNNVLELHSIWRRFSRMRPTRRC